MKQHEFLSECGYENDDLSTVDWYKFFRDGKLSLEDVVEYVDYLTGYSAKYLIKYLSVEEILMVYEKHIERNGYTNCRDFISGLPCSEAVVSHFMKKTNLNNLELRALVRYHYLSNEIRNQLLKNALSTDSQDDRLIKAILFKQPYTKEEVNALLENEEFSSEDWVFNFIGNSNTPLEYYEDWLCAEDLANNSFEVRNLTPAAADLIVETFKPEETHLAKFRLHINFGNTLLRGKALDYFLENCGDTIIARQNVELSLIEKHYDKLNKDLLAKHQWLSEELVEASIESYSTYTLAEFQNFSEAFYKRHRIPLSKNKWKYMSPDEKFDLVKQSGQYECTEDGYVFGSVKYGDEGYPIVKTGEVLELKAGYTRGSNFGLVFVKEDVEFEWVHTPHLIQHFKIYKSDIAKLDFEDCAYRPKWSLYAHRATATGYSYKTNSGIIAL